MNAKLLTATALATLWAAGAVAQQRPPVAPQKPPTVEVLPPNGNPQDPNRSRDLATAEISPVPEQVIELRPGAQTVIRLSRPFSSVTVGNPSVVDVIPRSDRVITLMGRKVGSADIIVFDNSVDIYRITATVGAPREGGRVMAHSKKDDLHHYYAYECSPVCTRIKDELEGPPAVAPIIIEAPGSAAAAGASSSSNIQVIMPPAAPVAPPR